MSRPKIYTAPPVSIRLDVELHDQLCREALARRVDLAVVMRERLSTVPVSQNLEPAKTSAQ